LHFLKEQLKKLEKKLKELFKQKKCSVTINLISNLLIEIEILMKSLIIRE